MIRVVGKGILNSDTLAHDDSSWRFIFSPSTARPWILKLPSSRLHRTSGIDNFPPRQFWRIIYPILLLSGRRFQKRLLILTPQRWPQILSNSTKRSLHIVNYGLLSRLCRVLESYDMYKRYATKPTKHLTPNRPIQIP